MHTLKIYGASDDLIEIEGENLDEEFSAYDLEDNSHLAISDGTLLAVEYDKDGIWRFRAVFQAPGTKIEKVEGTVEPDTGTDTLTLTSEQPFKWVLLGFKFSVKKRP